MDDSPLGLLRLALPIVPGLVKAAIYHTLWLSPTSTKRDLSVELITHFIRSLLNSPKPNPISKQQTFSLKDNGIKGNMWISKVTYPVPSKDNGESIKSLLTDAIEAMRTSPSQTYTSPTFLPVEAEWTGYRANVPKDRPRPDLSEAQHYENLMKEVSPDGPTILYFHGGAFYMMDPASHRPATARLAQLTGGRCLSVRYRLSPQNAFPTALLDAFVAYLALLYPPEGSVHEAVPTKKIVLGGDSAGGNLCFALVLLILQINRTYSSLTPSTSIPFHNHHISLPIPLPAAITSSSPWLDTTRCLPSIYINAKYDYLPPPLTPSTIATFPSCPLWPTDPPRRDLYSNTSMMTHPLVSPLAATVQQWHGCPSIWIGVGEEMLSDESRAVAGKIARAHQAVKNEKGKGEVVRWELYSGMPHCFGMIFEQLGNIPAKRYMQNWATFMQLAVKVHTSSSPPSSSNLGIPPTAANGSITSHNNLDKEEIPPRLESRAEIITGRKCEQIIELSIFGDEDDREHDLCPFSDEDVAFAMRKAQKAREKGQEGEGKILPRF